MMHASFRGPPPRLAVPPLPRPIRLIPIVDADQAREQRMLAVLEQLGFGICRRCGATQVGARGGLCLAHQLAERASRVSEDECVCWRQDPTLERLTRDTEPLLSSERDTRDTERPPPAPHVDWAAP